MYPLSAELDEYGRLDDHGHANDHIREYPAMRMIRASDFKARCLALMDDVARSGEVLVVTKNGRPIAELHPYSGGRDAAPFGLHRDLKIHGDIVAPVGEEDWEALG